MDDLKEYLVTEFVEEYEDGFLSRPEMERRIVGVLGDEAEAYLRSVPMNSVEPQPPAVPPSSQAADFDDLVDVTTVTIPVEGGELSAYFARPKGGGTVPGVIAVHENRGLTPHIKFCARKLASAGYAVLAPDLLSRAGGTDSFAEPADAIAAIGQSDSGQNVEDLLTALTWLGEQDGVDGERLAATGWCWGGANAWRLATRAGSRIRAAVPWYGPVPSEGWEGIEAPVFAIYGELDERVNAGLPTAVETMTELGKPFENKVYPGAQHAFNNDTAERYNEEQAKLAWQDMLDFLSANV